MDSDLSSKVVYGLERIGEALKALLWEKAKHFGISPIQIQILLFIADHNPELCNVSMLAKEFNVTKATVSDAVKVLNKKGLIEKTYSSTDSRSYSISISNIGKKLYDDLSSYNQPMFKALGKIEGINLETLYSSITSLIYQLNKNNILTVQRTCFGCKYYRSEKERHYCNLMQLPLKAEEIRLDCPEYENKSAD